MLEVVQWRCAQPGEVIQRAVELLCAGRLVAFPTDTCYEVAAHVHAAEAVARLQGTADIPLTLAVNSAAALLDWMPDVGSLGQRLARRCWPGPVTLVSQVGVDRGLSSHLPLDVRRRLCPDGLLSMRVPAHEAILQGLALLPAPLVLSGGTAVTADQIVRAAEDLALIIDDGPTYFGRPSTAVRVDGAKWEIVSPGVVSSAELEQLAGCRILFVCTGNTCRSPLAQALCAKLLADRLRCSPDELPRHGFIVQSAGLSAMIGSQATAEADAIAREFGADLSNHQSQPLTPELLVGADYVIAMTRSHLQILASLDNLGGPAPRLLSPQGDDIPDPIGSAAEVYRECARQIMRCLEELIPELPEA